MAVINETFAKANFGGRNPVGQHVTLRRDSGVARDMEIVGICRDSVYGSLTKRTPPVAYIAYDQGYPEPDYMVYALRTSGDPLRYVNEVHEILRQADARVPLSEVRTQAADIDRTLSQEITFARLCTVFAMLALVIATVGVYGAVSYSVARRTSEIGIRMALGAQRAIVVRMSVRDVMGLAAVALVAGRGRGSGDVEIFVESFLYGMKANDPAALTVAGLYWLDRLW